MYVMKQATGSVEDLVSTSGLVRTALIGGGVFLVAKMTGTGKANASMWALLAAGLSAAFTIVK